jgi:tetratricopeptide (TPR) repeat protein
LWAGIGVATAGFAQDSGNGTPAAARDQDYAAALSRMLAQIDDPEASFAFAQAAAHAGDFGAAITALERVLRLRPQADNVRLELGLLYLRVGQPDLARLFLSTALTSPDAPDFVRDRASAALATAQQATSRISFRGDVFAGVRGESNPEAAPSSALLVDPFRGQVVRLSGDQLSVDEQADVALVASASGALRIRLDHGPAPEFVLDGEVSASLYDRTESLNALGAGLRLGPRLYPRARLAPETVWRPYLAASGLSLNGDTYFTDWGAGIVADRRLGVGASLSAVAEWRRRKFVASAQRPTADDQSGDLFALGLQGTAALGERWRFSASSVVERADADAAFQARESLEVGAGLHRFVQVGPAIGAPVRLGASGRFRHTVYDAPDPVVSPAERRIEDRYVLSVEATAPVTRRIAIEARAEQTWSRATISNYRFDNTGLLVGLSARF